MFADVSEPAPYYCQVSHYTAWYISFGQLPVPEFYCNSVNSTLQFDDLEAEENVKGNSCFQQCWNGAELYTTPHECNPALCEDYDGEETFDDLNQDDYVEQEGEKEYDISSFALFELKFLFSVFILVNTFQAINCTLKIIMVNIGEACGLIFYSVILYICFIVYQIFLIKTFPKVFYF